MKRMKSNEYTSLRALLDPWVYRQLQEFGVHLTPDKHDLLLTRIERLIRLWERDNRNR